MSYPSHASTLPFGQAGSVISTCVCRIGHTEHGTKGRWCFLTGICNHRERRKFQRYTGNKRGGNVSKQPRLSGFEKGDKINSILGFQKLVMPNMNFEPWYLIPFAENCITEPERAIREL